MASATVQAVFPVSRSPRVVSEFESRRLWPVPQSRCLFSQMGSEGVQVPEQRGQNEVC